MDRIWQGKKQTQGLWVGLGLLGLLLGLSGGVLTGCRSSESVAEASVDRPAALPVRVQQVKEGTLQRQMSFPGDVRAQTSVTLKAEINGRIAAVLVDEGDSVRQGDPLVRLDDTLLQIQVRQAEAALEAARIRWEQAQALARLRSEVQRDQALAALESARATAERLKAVAALQSETQLKQAEAGLEALRMNLKKIRAGAREQERKQIQATVAQAEANLRNAEANFRRTEQLFKEGVISEQSYDGARTAFAVAQAQYEAAKQQLALVEEGARPEDIAAMEAQVRQAAAALELARQSAQARTWEKDLAAAEARVRQAEAGLKLAEAQLEAKSWQAEIDTAAATVRQLEAALELAQERLQKATLRAPMDGIITRRFAEPGMLASPTAPLLEFAAIDTVEVVAQVPEEKLRQIQQGATVQVVTTAYPERTFSGKINRIGSSVDPATRTVEVVVTLENSDHRLRPGMFARMLFQPQVAERRVLIPRVAVRWEKDTPIAFVVKDQQAQKRTLTLGESDDQWVEVLEGIRSGESVVVLGQQALEDSTPIQVIP